MIRQRDARDHRLGDDHLVHKLAELPTHGLSVLEALVHRDRLLLQGLYLCADAAQVCLEPLQHLLHALTHGNTSMHLR